MTFKCAFQPSKTNGHWHLTQKEAERCMKSWESWNNPKVKQLKDYSNRPGGSRPDMDSRSEI